MNKSIEREPRIHREIVLPHDFRVSPRSPLRLVPPPLRLLFRQTYRATRHKVRKTTAPYDLYKTDELIFIHIAKNAGSFVNGLVYPELDAEDSTAINAHHTAQYLAKLDHSRFSQYYKFAILRRPSDRLRSAFNYLRSDSPFTVDREFARRTLSEFGDFADFCERVDDRRMAELMSWPHFQPQSSYVCSPTGELMVNSLLVLDDLSAGLVELGRTVGLDLSELPTREVSYGGDESADRIVSSFYEADVELYNMVIESESSLYMVDSVGVDRSFPARGKGSVR